MTKKLWIIIGLSLLMCLSIFFKVIWTFDCFHSQITRNQSAEHTISRYNVQESEEEGPKNDLFIELFKADKMVFTHEKNNRMGGELVHLLVIVDDFEFESSGFSPFEKHISMTYKSSIESVKDNGLGTVISGEVNGTLKGTFKGFVRTKRAQELLEEQAIEAVKEYVLKTFGH